MKSYETLSIEIISFQADDVVTTSPGGVDYGNGDLNWGWGGA